jgi:hypothetical protein
MKTLEEISKQLTTLDAIELHGGELTHLSLSKEL